MEPGKMIQSKQIIRRKYSVLIFLIILLSLSFCSKAEAKKYSVKFASITGSASAAYAKFNTKVEKNQYITLPEVNKVKGYQVVGWVLSKNSNAKVYRCGTRVKVTRNLQFYLRRRKSNYYTVTFLNNNGTTSQQFRSLNRKVEEGTTIRIPGVPQPGKYIGLGWSSKKGASTVSTHVGDQITVKRNCTFYAVFSKNPAVTITYYDNTGTKVYLTENVVKGSRQSLAGVRNLASYTMMGWSLIPGKKTNPKYYVGQKVIINRNLKLYAVMFDKRSEENIDPENMTLLNLEKYKEVIFVGDSRTARMRSTLKKEGFDISHSSFVAKGWTDLLWLKTEGYDQIVSILDPEISIMTEVETEPEPEPETEVEEEISSPILSDRVAIVFNHGVNDLQNANEYITYMKKIAPALQKKGCDLFYMSVNPVNNTVIKNRTPHQRPEQDIRNFNAAVYQQLCLNGSYHYIDTYHYLMKNGFSYDASSVGVDSGVDDGLHYTTRTYKRIYQYCMKLINRT